MNEEPPCSCATPGFCPRFQINQDPYAHAVCQSGDEKSNRYRRKWRVRLETIQQNLSSPIHPRTVVKSPPVSRHTAKKTPFSYGLGSELNSLLGKGMCGGTIASMNRWDTPLSPQNRTWILDYLKSRWKRQINEVVEANNLPRDNPEESVLELALSRLQERRNSHEDRTSNDRGSVHDESVSVPAIGERSQQDEATRGPNQNGKATVGERVPDQPIIPGRPSLPSGRYRVGPAQPPVTNGQARPASSGPVNNHQPIPSPLPKRPTQPLRSRTPTLQTWAVGVTTVPERKYDLLPRTLACLEKGGFHSPRLFVDGCDTGLNNWYEKYFELPVTARYPRVNGYANWVLSAWELFLRNPDATRYCIFQDDILIPCNLREYLDSIPYPEKGYINLTSFRENEYLCKPGMPKGIVQAMEQRRSNSPPTGTKPQHGRGAMGLIFDRPAMTALLRSPHITARILPEKRDPDRYYRFIDGAVIEAMNGSGFREYIHNPALLQHNGPVSVLSSTRRQGKVWGPSALCKTWVGEEFDCLTLLPQRIPAMI